MIDKLIDTENQGANWLAINKVVFSRPIAFGLVVPQSTAAKSETNVPGDVTDPCPPLVMSELARADLMLGDCRGLPTKHRQV